LRICYKRRPGIKHRPVEIFVARKLKDNKAFLPGCAAGSLGEKIYKSKRAKESDTTRVIERQRMS
jgi:hypothetical protein